MGFVGDTVESIRSIQVRHVLSQIISLGMILTLALDIWKGLIVATRSESPVVVVLSGSMEPLFKRLWLQQHHIMGRAVGFLPYVGWVTIFMTEKPFIKTESIIGVAMAGILWLTEMAEFQLQ